MFRYGFKKIIALLLIAAVIIPFHAVAERSSEKIIFQADRPKFSEETVRSVSDTIRGEYREGEVIVKYKKDALDISDKNADRRAEKMEKKEKLAEIGRVEDLNIKLLRTGGKTTEKAIEILENDPQVEYAEPNYVRPLAASVNDTYFPLQWGLNNAGQEVLDNFGTPDADIDAPEAWDAEQNTNTTVVAVIDAGVDYKHPDLAGNMWDGSSCKSDTGTTVAGGCPNHGWSYYSQYEYFANYLLTGDTATGHDDPMDEIGHGTMMAGIIGAVSNNSLGVSGLSRNNKVKIMAAKFGLDVFSEIKAINFAKHNGAKVISASYGATGASQGEKDAIAAFPGIFVTAAGNGGDDKIGDDLDGGSSAMYPCSYDLQNIVCVAATNQNDSLASFSNYGAYSVDLAAPGTNILNSYIFPSTNSSSDTYMTVGSPRPSEASSFPAENALDGSESTYWLTNSSGSFPHEFIIELDTTYSGVIRGFSYLPHQNENIPNGIVTGYEIYASADGANWGTAIKSGTLAGDRSRKNIFFDTPASGKYLKFKALSDSASSQYASAADMFVFLQGYAYGSGTSQAVPFVAGTAAMMLNQNNSLSVSQIRHILLNSGDAKASLNGKVNSGRRLNLRSALAMAGGNVSLPATTDTFRFWSDQKQGHFFTNSVEEKNNIQANYPTTVWKYEGVAFKSGTVSGSERLPVHRFWSNKHQSHFFTISEAEKNHILDTYPEATWRYEGVGWYAYSSHQTDALPVYRFWSDQKQKHFYTTSSAEKDHIIKTYSPYVWRYEGVAWHTPAY